MKRVASLDSIRGIAAFVVVLYHCSLVIPGVHDRLEATYLLRPLVAGPEAVYVFFVLSGFVLYGMLATGDPPSYSTFAAKRLLRLWLPVAAAVTVSAFLFAMVRPAIVPGASYWLREVSWNQPLSAANVAGHLALFGGNQFHQLDNPIWSLSHEVKISLIFPIIAMLVARRPAGTLAVATFISLVAPLMPQPKWLADTLDPLGSLTYLSLFVAGAILAAYRDSFAKVASSSLGRKLALPLLLVSMVLLCSSGTERPTFLVSIGAVILIGLGAVSSSIAGPLEHPVLQWLGRISYSLYLVHVVVLLTLVHAFHAIAPLPWLVASVVPLSLAVAEVFYRLIERPSIMLARRVAARRRGAGSTHGEIALLVDQPPFVEV